MHGAQRRRPNYAGIATGSGSPPGSGCYRCGSPPSSTGSPGLPGTQFDEACLSNYTFSVTYVLSPPVRSVLAAYYRQYRAHLFDDIYAINVYILY